MREACRLREKGEEKGCGSQTGCRSRSETGTRRVCKYPGDVELSFEEIDDLIDEKEKAAGAEAEKAEDEKAAKEEYPVAGGHREYDLHRLIPKGTVKTQIISSHRKEVIISPYLLWGSKASSFFFCAGLKIRRFFVKYQNIFRPFQWGPSCGERVGIPALVPYSLWSMDRLEPPDTLS